MLTFSPLFFFLTKPGLASLDNPVKLELVGFPEAEEVLQALRGADVSV